MTMQNTVKLKREMKTAACVFRRGTAACSEEILLVEVTQQELALLLQREALRKQGRAGAAQACA